MCVHNVIYIYIYIYIYITGSNTNQFAYTKPYMKSNTHKHPNMKTPCVIFKPQIYTLHTHLYTDRHSWLCVFVCIYRYTYRYTYRYIYIHTHTHTHIYIYIYNLTFGHSSILTNHSQSNKLKIYVYNMYASIQNEWNTWPNLQALVTRGRFSSHTISK
jgi:hypothetical protein